MGGRRGICEDCLEVRCADFRMMCSLDQIVSVMPYFMVIAYAL